MNRKQLEERKAAIWGEINEMRQKFDGKAMSEEERQQWDKLFADYRALEADLRRMDEFEALAARAAQPAKAGSEQRADMNDILKRMVTGQLTDEERRTFTPTTVDGMSGANIVPKEVSSICEVAMTDAARILNEIDIIRTQTGAELGLPTVNDSNGRAEATPDYQNVDMGKFTINSVNLKAHNYRTKIIPVSYAVIQDSAVNMPELIGRLLGEQFGRGFQYDITKNGTSETAKMRGLIAAAHTINGGSSNAISFDDITALMFGVKGAYHANAKWMLNSETLRQIMKLTDSEGHYIFQPSLSASIPGVILGKEYFYNDDMDTIGAAKKVLAFGDFKKYKMRVVTELSLITLKERLVDWLCYGFMGYQRADGALVDAGTHPIAVLKTAGGSGSGSGSGSGAGE